MAVLVGIVVFGTGAGVDQRFWGAKVLAVGMEEAVFLQWGRMYSMATASGAVRTSLAAAV